MDGKADVYTHECRMETNLQYRFLSMARVMDFVRC